MRTHQNPLFADQADAHADMSTLESPTVFVDRRRGKTAKRMIRDARRMDTAAEAVADFDHETTIHGLTKGQFSLIDVLTALIKTTGPASLDISTWTAAKTDVTTVCQWLRTGGLTSSRWLVDLTFQRRTPELATLIRELFGREAIRVAQNHCKFAILRNEEWAVVVQTSMNLNFNPRFENFTVAHDEELAGFYGEIFDEIWEKQSRSIASNRPYDIHKHFANDL